MDPTVITVPAAIIAIVNMIKKYVPQVHALVTVLVAAVLGAVAGYYHIQGVPDVLSGLILGLSASGAVTVADRVANNPATQ